MSGCESDPIRQWRASRLALIFLQGYGLIRQSPDFIRPKQPRDREPQLPFCDVNTWTDAATVALINQKGANEESRSSAMAGEGWDPREQKKQLCTYPAPNAQ